MARTVTLQPGVRGLLSIADWTGGLNTRVSPFLIRDNQAQKCVNYFFGLGGVLKVRPGAERKNAVSMGAGAVRGGERFYPVSGASRLLVDHGTTWRESTDAGLTFSTLTLPSGVTLSAFTRANYIQADDLAFRADGINQPLTYDGTTVQKWGIAGPATAGTGTEVGGGSLTTVSTYKWAITFVTATAESNGSTTVGSLTLTGANNKIDLTGIPLGPAGSGTTKRRIYRTKAGGAIYYFEEAINDNVTTIASLDIADSALGAEMPEDKEPPPADLQYIELFKNRVIGVKASNLRQILVSELFEYEAFPPSFAFTIPFPEGDKCSGLRAKGDLLFIFGTSTIFAMIGDSPFNFTIRQTYADEGSVSQWGIIEVENVVMYRSRFAFHAFDGANSKVISVEIEPTLRNELSLSKSDETAGVYDTENRLARWACTVSVGAGTRKEYVFDLFRRAWTTTNRKIALYIPFRGSPDQGELFTGDPDNGYVWKENVGNADNAANIVATYITKAYNVGQPRFFKRFWHLFLDFKPTSGALVVEVNGDSGLVLETFNPSIAGSSAVYGTAEYGIAEYGGPLILSFDEGFTYDPAISDDFLAKYADYKMEYTGQGAFELYRADTELEVEAWLRKT